MKNSNFARGVRWPQLRKNTGDAYDGHDILYRIGFPIWAIVNDDSDTGKWLGCP